MSVKRYELCHLGGGLYSMMEDSDGEFVRYEDHTLLEQKLTDMAVQLANADSKCSELAAENSALKATCDDRRTFIMNGVQLGYIKVPTVDTDPALETIRIAVSPQEPTPVTDTFLAEVRAQGVDYAIDHLNKIFDAKEDIGEPIRALEWLAQAIRKGAAL
ncbi:hypothetical protein [Citrobacter freundii]|uniref:hypothetical protein n=1 Tax=Citrobacter freundii TaxID=546 RepID=UPI00292C6BE1|nr:hypothetical protein [Citrobacter freundii]MDV0835112.1 hypothetical protein [Citrobacter freundii]MDV0870923.1 hypothetical protein [Citrobacter freundii]MDV0905267.1 hypothetical protein [Citrobacter freundii]MDV1670004.1 hypothetical protein [Citrobacter freundii]MDV1708242.1 hypothetical protein [Citrobacter freundii]